MSCEPKIPLLLISLLISGCAINNYGLLAARVTHVDGAMVVDVYGIGGYLRTWPDDPGVTFGWTRRSYVFSERLEQLQNPGWRYFSVQKPDDVALVQDTRALGFDLSFANPVWNATFGYKVTTILARIRSEFDRSLQLFYWPSYPSETRLKYCEEQNPC